MGLGVVVDAHVGEVLAHRVLEAGARVGVELAAAPSLLVDRTGDLAVELHRAAAAPVDALSLDEPRDARVADLRSDARRGLLLRLRCPPACLLGLLMLVHCYSFPSG